MRLFGRRKPKIDPVQARRENVARKARLNAEKLKHKIAKKDA